MTDILRLTVLRSLIFVAGVAVFSGIMHLLPSDGTSDADFGPGLLLFGLIWLAAFVWGLLDGRRHRLLPLTITWALVGCLVGAALAVGVALTDSEVDRSVFLSDLATFVSLFAPSIVALALVGAAIGSTRPVHTAE